MPYPIIYEEKFEILAIGTARLEFKVHNKTGAGTIFIKVTKNEEVVYDQPFEMKAGASAGPFGFRIYYSPSELVTVRVEVGYDETVTDSREWTITPEEIIVEERPPRYYTVTVVNETDETVITDIGTFKPGQSETYTVSPDSRILIITSGFIFEETGSGTAYVTHDMTLTIVKAEAPPPPTEKGTLDIRAYVDDREVPARVEVVKIG